MKSDAENLYNIIGSNIKEKRKENGFTQKEFAKIFHVSPSTMSHYEEGVNKIPLPILIAIADYYDVPLDSIIGRRKYCINAKKYNEKVCAELSIDELVEKISKLSLGSQKLLKELLNYLK